MAYGYVKPSTIHTPVSGQIAPTSWGTAVNTALGWLAPASAIIRRAAAQSVGDSTDNLISFDTEDIDDAGFFTTDDPTKITFPRAGMYLLDIEVQFATDADGVRLVQLNRSGGAADFGLYQNAINGGITTVKFQFITGQRDTTDYYEVNAWHNAGGALNLTARAAVSLIQERST